MSRPELLPGQPADRDGAPVFEAPWQAKAFALTVHLHAQGVFTWSEWAAALGAALPDAPSALADGAAYYGAWLRALEALLAEKRLAAPEVVAAVTDAWHRAAEATPHGTPIRLGGPGA